MRGLFLPAFLLIFLFDDVAHGGGVGNLFIAVHDAARGFGTESGGLSGGGFVRRASANGIGRESRGVGSSDVQIRSSGNGVLVGPEKEEVPVVVLCLVVDLGGDLFPGEFFGGVFVAVSKDGYDDLPGTVWLGGLFQPLAQTLDGLADGIEKSCGATGEVGVGIQRDHFLHGNVVHGDEVFVVKKYKSEAGLTWGSLLVTEEFVEARDSGGGNAGHRARAVEDEGDFSEIFIHAPTIAYWQRHLWGYFFGFSEEPWLSGSARYRVTATLITQAMLTRFSKAMRSSAALSSPARLSEIRSTFSVGIGCRDRRERFFM